MSWCVLLGEGKGMFRHQQFWRHLGSGWVSSAVARTWFQHLPNVLSTHSLQIPHLKLPPHEHARTKSSLSLQAPQRLLSSVTLSLHILEEVNIVTSALPRIFKRELCFSSFISQSLLSY